MNSSRLNSFTAGILVTLSIFLLVTGCATMHKDWQKAQTSDSIPGYEEFLRHHPKGQFADTARSRLKELYAERDWKATLSEDTISAYEGFLSQHPASKFADRARSRLKELYIYDQAITLKSQGDLQAAKSYFKEYLTHDPESQKARMANYYIWLIQSCLSQEKAWRECGLAISDISEISGAVFNPEIGSPVLLGKKQEAHDPGAPLALDDLMTAIRVVRQGEDPGVSIEPASGIDSFMPLLFFAKPPSNFTVRYIPSFIEDTHLGWLFFDADRTLKSLCLGTDNLTGAEVTTSVPGYRSIPARMRGQTVSSGYFAAPIFTPREIKLAESVTGNNVRLIWFDEIIMGVKSQSGQPAAAEFVRHLEENFDLFAEELPSFRALVQVVRLVAIARWVIGLPGLDWSMFEKYKPCVFSTPDETSTVTAGVARRHEERASKTYILYGGVLLSTPNTYVSAKAIGTYVERIELSDLVDKVLPARPSRTAMSWDSSIGKETYQAVIIPL